MFCSAAELYSHSQGIKCQGNEKCHWCAAPCDRCHSHDDNPLIPFIKITSTARMFANNWICRGCFLYRSTKTTIQYINGELEDGKSPRKFSWFITPSNAYALDKKSSNHIYSILLDPPRIFSLSLLDDHKINNEIHLTVVNEPVEMKMDTRLAFTLNNVIHYYTAYELKEVLLKRKPVSGKEPGIQALLKWLGPYTEPIPEIKRDRGRPQKLEPDDGKITQKTIAMSGGIRRR